jgi:YfiH family protein
MKKITKNGLVYLVFDSFEKYNFIQHGFSTKNGGFSEGHFSSMNLRLKSSDDPVKVEKNFQKFLDVFDLTKENTVLTNQVHGKNIIKVDNNMKNYESSDGLVTDTEGIGLMTFHADCIPVYFADINKKVIGIVHSGWSGTLEGIAVEMLDLMEKSYDSRIEDIIVGIGPGIGSCCYEVGEELFKQFTDKKITYGNYFEKKANKYMLDLKGLIQHDLVNKGILEKNIEVSSLCTKCNQELFFSHRGQGLKRGGMAAVIKKVR